MRSFLLCFLVLFAGAAYGQPATPTPNADLNRDGVIDAKDIFLFFDLWHEGEKFTPTSTSTPTEIVTPENTSTDTPTSTFTETETDTETPTETPTELPTDTPFDIDTPTETPTGSLTPLIAMLDVASGTFTMGRTDAGDDGSYGFHDELPRHEVTLSAYQIGKFEVTNGQFAEVLNWANGMGYLEGLPATPTDIPTNTPTGTETPTETPTDTPTPLVALVNVASVTFTMGRSDLGDDADFGRSDELPRHEVTLSAYQIGEHEVTNAQYCEALNWANGMGYLTNSTNGAYNGGDVYASGQKLLGMTEIYCQISYGGLSFYSNTRDSYSMADHPVVYVTWYGAVAFCNWLSEKDGLTPCYDLTTWALTVPYPNGYRLPTEAEWEQAAAWDGSKHWIYGFTSGEVVDANRSNCTSAVNPLVLTSHPYTSPVGWFNGVNVSSNGTVQTVNSPSSVGCYDMSGNVYEWCQDWYDAAYYEGGTMTNPTGPATGSYRVLRGGSWFSESYSCRSAFRFMESPDFGDFNRGFRIVRSEGDAPAPIPPSTHISDVYSGGDVYAGGQILLEVNSPECQIFYSEGSFISKTRDGYSMEDHPVLCLSWYGAVAFCNWLSEKEGLTPAYDYATWGLIIPYTNGYRLPTEAEWERAAAWDGSKHWIYGFMSDTLTGNDRCAYELRNPFGLAAVPYTSPVGWFNGAHTNPNGDVQTLDSPSPVGAYDMCGNVWEWCNDWYGNSYYEGGSITDPTGPTSGSDKIQRGGGWGAYMRNCRTAIRYGGFPEYPLNYMGFRVARTP